MLDLTFDQEQEMLRDVVRSLCAERSPLTVVRELEDDPTGYPAELWKQLAELDLLGLLIPAEHGGSGMTLLEGVVLYEELGRALAPSPHFASCVVSAGLLHLVTPALFALPGIAAYKMFPNLDRPDHAYLMLVKSLVPAGLRGLILAAMAAALMSTLSAVINSTSTLLTLDIYKKVIRPNATEHQQVRFGQWSGVIVLLTATFAAFYYSTMKDSFLFIIIQNIFAYIAPPFAVIFTLGILWRRANGTAALTTGPSGGLVGTPATRREAERSNLQGQIDAVKKRRSEFRLQRAPGEPEPEETVVELPPRPPEGWSSDEPAV